MYESDSSIHIRRFFLGLLFSLYRVIYDTFQVAYNLNTLTEFLDTIYPTGLMDMSVVDILKY